jgi:quercetin dioxygenase-like cupin family protein
MQFPEKDQIWVPYADALPKDCGEGVTRRVLAWTDGLMCVENTFEKGSGGAPHTHPHTQITYVLSGRFSFTVGGETRTVGPGDSLLVKGGVVHGCDCLETGKVLDVFTPAREDFLPG